MVASAVSDETKCRLNNMKRAYFIVLAMPLVLIAGTLLLKDKLFFPRGYYRTEYPGILISPRNLDLGDIASGEKAVGAFKIMSRTNSPIVVSRVLPGCGCTAVDFSPKTLLKKQTMEVPIAFTSGINARGKFMKRVGIELLRKDTGAKHVIRASFHGNIHKSSLLQFVPGVIDFGTVTKGVTFQKRVLCYGDKALIPKLPKVIAVDSNNLPQKVDMSVDAIAEADETASMLIEFQPDDSLSLGSYESAVHVEIEGCIPQRVILPIRAEVVPAIISSPRRIYMASVNGKPPAPSKFAVKSVAGKAIDVTNIESKLPLEFTCDQTKGEQLEVTMTPRTTDIVDRNMQGSIVVHVDEADTLTIPVFWSNIQQEVSDVQMENAIE